jgi:beta-lactamase class A
MCAALSGMAYATSSQKPGGTPSPASDWQTVQSYLTTNKPVSFHPLVPELLFIITNNVQGRYSLYLEDLNNGSVLGINDNDRYNGWSLLKVAVMATVMKKIQMGAVTLDQDVILSKTEAKAYSHIRQPGEPGDRVTVRALLERLIRYSDNTASMALARVFTAEEFQQALQALGMPTAPPGTPRNTIPHFSPRDFGNMLRGLYYPGYLKKPFCDTALVLMSNTAYDSQIRSSLPGTVRVAHKVGFNAAHGEFHDCGIVYVPARPYILCIMSTGSTREEADRVIPALSKKAYEFFTQDNKRHKSEP